MPALKGLIRSITSDEMRIKLVGGNTVTYPYDDKYKHMREYDIIWVFTHNGEITELHTLECIKQKSELPKTPTNILYSPELIDEEYAIDVAVQEGSIFSPLREEVDW